MPAQTHGRVRNGFHIQAPSRSVSKNLFKPPCDSNSACERGFCCGTPIQPAWMKPQGCRRGLCSFTPNRGRKRALALGGVGSRSGIVKRAISRRVQNRNQMAPGYQPSATRPSPSYVNTNWPTTNAVCTDTQQTNGGCACCLITVTKNHPRNACLGTCQNKSNN